MRSSRRTKVGADVGLVKVSNLQALPIEQRGRDELDAIVDHGRREGARLPLERPTGEARLAWSGAEVGADLDRIVDFLETSASWVEAGLAAGRGGG